MTPDNLKKFQENFVYGGCVEERLSAMIQIFFDILLLLWPLMSQYMLPNTLKFVKIMLEKEVPTASGTAKIGLRKLLHDRFQEILEKKKKEEAIVSKKKTIQKADTEEKKELEIELDEKKATTKCIQSRKFLYI